MEALTEPTKPRQREKPKDNVKETLESILVAFILAFVFRAFVVEAFVIPSGSMATTLMGAHLRLRCAECGYDFTVNYPVATRDDTIALPARTGPKVVEVTTAQDDGSQVTTRELQDTAISMHCPNCGFKVPEFSPDVMQSARNTPVNYGDRILVLKYLYLLENPRRWDVVVFKSPSEGRSDYSINFIKRLVGLPGELLMVLDGDVYTSPDIDKPPDQRTWTVQAKPRYAQQSLWRVAYDNDYYPINAGGRKWQFPWKARSGRGWQLGGPAGPGRAVSFDNADGEGSLLFDRDANPGTFPLTDWLPYNETKPVEVGNDGMPHGDHYAMEAYAQERVPRWNVSDLKVQFLYQRTNGNGPLRASLTKLGHRFTAEILPGKATLTCTLPDQRRLTIGQAALKEQPGEPMFVEFSNVDYRVSLRINDREVIASTAAQYHPSVADLLERSRKQDSLATPRAAHEKMRDVFDPPSVELSAGRQSATLTHLSLWRDIYYTPHYHERSSFQALTNARPENPIHLHRGGPGVEPEYFVLGDNSILSGDARAWDSEVHLRETEDLVVGAGRVPERFLLGKAFFVYWPAGFRPLTPDAPGVVPNFGKMRFIH